MPFKDEHYNIDADSTIQAGSAVISAVAPLFAKKDKGAIAEGIKATCGKKPRGFLGIKGAAKKAKIAAYNKCSADYSKNIIEGQKASLETQRMQMSYTETGMSPVLKYSLIGGGVLVFAAVMFFVIKKV